MTEAAVYTPRPGSKAESALAALEREGWLSVDDMATEIDVDRSAVHAYLGIPIKHGAIRLVARDGKGGFALSGDDQPATASREKFAREKPPQLRNRARPNGDAAPTVVPAIDPPGSVAIADDGSILLIDGDRITARLTAQQARNIAAMAARFK